MTTIARRGAYLVVDSQICADGSVIAYQPKMFHKPGWGAIAFTGAAAVYGAAADWIVKGCNPDTVPGNGLTWGALVLKADGECYWVDNHGHTLPMDAEYTAEGSGMTFALGALATGATPMTAVEAASKHDPYTGGELSIYVADKDKVRGETFNVKVN